MKSEDWTMPLTAPSVISPPKPNTWKTSYTNKKPNSKEISLTRLLKLPTEKLIWSKLLMVFSFYSNFLSRQRITTQRFLDHGRRTQRRNLCHRRMLGYLGTIARTKRIEPRSNQKRKKLYEQSCWHHEKIQKRVSLIEF